MTTAQVEPDGLMASRAGPAAISAALAVMALVTANRAPKHRPARTREEAGERDPGARAIGRELRGGPLDEPAPVEPGRAATTRRLPTGLY